MVRNFLHTGGRLCTMPDGNCSDRPSLMREIYPEKILVLAVVASLAAHNIRGRAWEERGLGHPNIHPGNLRYKLGVKE